MTMENEATVFVVDDDGAVRDALRSLFESVNLNVETFESAEQFLRAYQPERPGCLVLDIRMPGMGGLRLLEHLKSQAIPLPVIVLTGYADVNTAVRAMKAGAVDFVQKPFTEQELLEQIQKALEQDARLRSERAKQSEIEARLARLTPRERQVFERLVGGKTNKDIAADLGISAKTVETHRAHIMQKMQAKSLAELVRLALRHHRYS